MEIINGNRRIDTIKGKRPSSDKGNLQEVTDNGATTTKDITANFFTGTGIEITDATKGIILKSPDNTRWRITIDNTGALISTSL